MYVWSLIAAWWAQVWPNVIANILANPLALSAVYLWRRAKKREQQMEAELHEKFVGVHHRFDELLGIHEQQWEGYEEGLTPPPPSPTVSPRPEQVPRDSPGEHMDNL